MSAQGDLAQEIRELLAETVDTDPGTPPPVLLERAAKCRRCLAATLRMIEQESSE